MNKMGIFLILLVGFLGITNAANSTVNVTGTATTTKGPVVGAPVKVKGPVKVLTGKVVIGAENRYKYNDRNYPWASVGKIVFGRNSAWMCTGILVGPRHVLTNAHCVDSKYPIYFYPSYRNGVYISTIKRVQGTLISAGTVTTDTSTGSAVSPAGFSFDNDWAVLLLNERTGDTFGWLGIRSFDSSWLKVPYWIMLSYPNAGTLNSYGDYPLYQSGCRIMEYDGSSYLTHDCDSNPGSSGSSIFGRFSDGTYSVVALNNAEPASRLNCATYIKYTCSNYAVNSNKFINAVSNARNQYP